VCAGSSPRSGPSSATAGGGGSELTWQALAGVDGTFSKHLSAKFGYRYLDFDYDQDDFVYDMAMAGGYAGLGIRF
jgi:opacity protein-like surface antigen